MKGRGKGRGMSGVEYVFWTNGWRMKDEGGR